MRKKENNGRKTPSTVNMTSYRRSIHHQLQCIYSANSAVDSMHSERFNHMTTSLKSAQTDVRICISPRVFKRTNSTLHLIHSFRNYHLASPSAPSPLLSRFHTEVTRRKCAHSLWIPRGNGSSLVLTYYDNSANNCTQGQMTRVFESGKWRAVGASKNGPLKTLCCVWLGILILLKL
jgi:hypothetical protein